MSIVVSAPHAVSMLRGTPPGYIGYEEPARLVDPLRHVPAQVVLLKHVDLAHPVVRETIADVLRNGELRDTRDRLASFRDAVVVLTMTVERGGRAVGFARRGQAEALAHGAVRDEAIKRLGPTLVELVDAVVPALPLDAAALDAIVERQLAELTEGARERGYEVDVELGVRELVAARLRAKGDARAVAYMLFEAVGEPLSRAIYAGPPRRMVLDVDGDRVVALARPRKPVSPARRARRQKVAA
jgi:ATP-dependent Clp protease ATP-binding subunit ClpA